MGGIEEMKKKILILDDNETLLVRLQENITKFEVVTSSDLDDAIEKLKTQDILFIAVDYDLGNDKTGDILSDLLFKSGKSVPAMVFSGKDLSEGTKKFLDDKGFSKIISKVEDQGTVSELIEQSAEEILESCASRVYDVRKRVEMVGNGHYPLKFGEEFKTISEWINELAKCNYAKSEKELKELIIAHCLALLKRQGNPEFQDK